MMLAIGIISSPFSFPVLYSCTNILQISHVPPHARNLPKPLNHLHTYIHMDTYRYSCVYMYIYSCVYMYIYCALVFQWPNSVLCRNFHWLHMNPLTLLPHQPVVSWGVCYY
jgi:hypothetical protein